MTADSFNSEARGVGVAEVLATQQRQERRHGNAAWRSATEIGKVAKLQGVSLAMEVDRAEMRGMIETSERGFKTWVKLSDLGECLFGLKGPIRDEARPAQPGDDDRHPPSELDPSSALVRLLIRRRSATSLVEDLAVRSGRDIEDFWEEVLQAERDGLVETWADHPSGPTVMLSSLTTERNGLRLSSDGTRWIDRDDPDPTSIDRPLRFSTETDCSVDLDRPDFLDTQADPRALTGPESLEAAEDAIRGCRRVEDAWHDRDNGVGPEVLALDHEASHDELWGASEREELVVRLPAPRLLLGLALVWPVMTPGADPPRLWRPGDGPCPACLGRALSSASYCLVCCRSGLDDIIRRMDPPSPARVARSRQTTAKSSRASKATSRRAGTDRPLRGGLG